jgi:hypothetical protein
MTHPSVWAFIDGSPGQRLFDTSETFQMSLKQLDMVLGMTVSAMALNS